MTEAIIAAADGTHSRTEFGSPGMKSPAGEGGACPMRGLLGLFCLPPIRIEQVQLAGYDRSRSRRVAEGSPSAGKPFCCSYSRIAVFVRGPT